MRADRKASTDAWTESVRRLEPYVSTEIDASDDTQFLAICTLLGVANKHSTPSDTELVAIFARLKPMYALHGIDIPHDFDKLAKECEEAHILRTIDAENDRTEIEISRSKEKIAEMYIKKKKLEELIKEKRKMMAHTQEIEKKRRVAGVVQEIVALAKHLGISTTSRRDGRTKEAQADTEEYVEAFHALFMPFVDLSVEAVHYLYSQIDSSTHTDKAERVVQYIQRTKHRIHIRHAKTHAQSIEERIEYGIVDTLIDNKTISISNLCFCLGHTRAHVIERVFCLCMKDVIVYDRTNDSVSFVNKQ